MKKLPQIYMLVILILLCILSKTVSAQSLQIRNSVMCQGKPIDVDVSFYSPAGDNLVSVNWYRNNTHVAMTSNRGNYYTYQLPFQLSEGDRLYGVANTARGTYTSNTILAAFEPTIEIGVILFTSASTGEEPGQRLFCPDTDKTLTAAGDAFYYEWYHNGRSVSTEQTYIPAQLNDYDAIYVEAGFYDVCYDDPRIASEGITVRTSPHITPAITLTSEQNNVCQGSNITFKTNVTNVPQNYGYTYSWYKNNEQISGVNTPVYSPSDLVNGDQILAKVYSAHPCVTQNAALSNIIVAQVRKPDTMKLELSGNNRICNWNDVTVYLEAENVSQGQIADIEWAYNGEYNPEYNVSSDPYTFNLRQGTGGGTSAEIKCRVTAKSETCLINRQVESAPFMVNIIPTVNHFVTIGERNGEITEGSTGNEICNEKGISLIAYAVPANYSHTYSWYLNENLIADSIKKTFTVTPDLINRYSENFELNVKASVRTSGECMSNRYKESGIVSLKIMYPPAAPNITLAVIPGCGQALLRSVYFPASLYAYWQTSSGKESFDYYGRNEYRVTQPGTYFLRAYNGCWGGEKAVTVNPSDIKTPVISGFEQNCNSVSLNLKNTGGETFTLIKNGQPDNTQSVGKIMQAGTYGIRGNSSGCVSDVFVVAASDIPRGTNCDQNYIRERIVQAGSITDGIKVTSENALVNYTYFDGLGRPMQMVAVGASPDGKDIVTPIVYDAFGREAKKYLPYKAGTGDGAYKTDALTAQPAFYTTPLSGITLDDTPWSETIFEPSPLNRVTEQYGPGKLWKDNGRSAKTDYAANATDEVRLWKKTAAGIDGTAFYAAGTLYKTVTRDEDGNTVTVYTDLQERTVQQESALGDGTRVLTQYAYDDFGRPAYVIQPKYHDGEGLSYIIADDDDDFDKYVFAYRYDERGRVTEKHIPGAGWTHIVYNKLDLPVLVQNAEQADKNPKEWNFTKYDAHGRVVATGLYTSAESSEMLQSEVYAAAQWESRTSGADYTSNAFPTSGGTTLAVNYYDNYAFPAGHPFAGAASDRPHGLPTGSKTKVLDASPEKWLYSVTCYDAKGRVSRSVERLPAGDDKDVDDETVFEYDFVGRVKQARRTITKTE